MNIGDKILFTMKRCSCQGGGMTEEIGMIVGIANGWIQVNAPNGIIYIKPTDIIKVYED